MTGFHTPTVPKVVNILVPLVNKKSERTHGK